MHDNREELELADLREEVEVLRKNSTFLRKQVVTAFELMHNGAPNLRTEAVLRDAIIYTNPPTKKARKEEYGRIMTANEAMQIFDTSFRLTRKR